MLLVLVRHAHAGSRSAWIGDDRRRPLSPKGEAQARGLAEALAGHETSKIASSAYVRCVQTLEPLAEKAGVEITEEDRLLEGNGADAAARLVDDLEALGSGTVVLCSHGDVIPHLLSELVARGMTPDRNLVWQKASAWSIDFQDGAWGQGRYSPPPGS